MQSENSVSSKEEVKLSLMLSFASSPFLGCAEPDECKEGLYEGFEL
jgi:hypothetical protein